MEGTNAISDYATITWTRASYLNLLDPLGELECAGRFHGSGGPGVYCTNYRYPRITGQGGLQHPHQLGVPERHVVTGVSSSVNVQERILPRTITFCPWRSSQPRWKSHFPT